MKNGTVVIEASFVRMSTALRLGSRRRGYLAGNLPRRRTSTEEGIMNWARGFKRTRIFLSLVAASAILVLCMQAGALDNTKSLFWALMGMAGIAAAGFLGVWIVLWVVYRLVRWVVLGFLDK